MPRFGPGSTCCSSKAVGRISLLGRATFPKACTSDLRAIRRLSATSPALLIIAPAIASIAAFGKVCPQFETHPGLCGTLTRCSCMGYNEIWVLPLGGPDTGPRNSRVHHPWRRKPQRRVEYARFGDTTVCASRPRWAYLAPRVEAAAGRNGAGDLREGRAPCISGASRSGRWKGGVIGTFSWSEVLIE